MLDETLMVVVLEQAGRPGRQATRQGSDSDKATIAADLIDHSSDEGATL